MEDPKNSKISKIEETKKRLYARKYQDNSNRRSTLKKRDYKVPSMWTDDGNTLNLRKVADEREALEEAQVDQDDSVDNIESADISGIADNSADTKKTFVPENFDEMKISKPKLKILSFWGMLGFAVLFLVMAISYAFIVFTGGGKFVSNESITINVVGPVSVSGGERISVDVVIQNNNPTTLEAADLVVNYPAGSKNTDLVTDLRRGRITIGDIAPGEVVKETLDMAFFGEEGESKKIDLDLEYQIAGSGAFFNKLKSFEIALSAAPIQILVDGLESISSGQEIEIDVEIRSNSDREIQDLMVVASYPFGFQFESADLKPTFGNNVWVFDKFDRDRVEKFTVKGNITAQDSEIRFFRFEAGLVSEENEEEIGVIFTNAAHDITIERPFIDLAMTINNESESPVNVAAGQQVSVVADFVNSTSDVITDAKLVFKLEGNILEKSSVKAGTGFYRSSDNTITFDKSNTSVLARIEPGQDEQFRFTFTTKTNQLEVTSPEVRISANINGNRLTNSDSEEKINETDLKIVQVLSDVFVQPFTLYDLGPFTNSGPIPPVVDQFTTYTILFSVSNNLNNLSDAKMTAVLPPYISWNDVVSPSRENVTYNSSSRTVTWNIGDVGAGVGHTGEPREVNFQVTLQPSISQKGDVPNLLSNVSFSAFDTFANTSFTNSIDPPTTLLQEQAGAINKHQIVIE